MLIFGFKPVEGRVIRTVAKPLLLQYVICSHLYLFITPGLYQTLRLCVKHFFSFVCNDTRRIKGNKEINPGLQCAKFHK